MKRLAFGGAVSVALILFLWNVGGECAQQSSHYPAPAEESQPPCFALQCSEWLIILNSAGYSDSWLLTANALQNCRPVDYDLLSGEWAAAIYYDGVANSGNDPTAPPGTATWLVVDFWQPPWRTNSAFWLVEPPQAWDDPANPASTFMNDTGRSHISNSQVDIVIDYEIADLGSYLASPMGAQFGTVPVKLAWSSRYVLLQTYTITNISGGTLNNVEFYQLLRSFPGTGHGVTATVESVYDPTYYPDSLQAYVPYNPVHNLGAFRYDITQFNNGDPAGWVDYVGFSCTVPPEMIGNNWFRTFGTKPPPPGTHWDVEARALNGSGVWAWGEVAGAEMWTWPQLAHQDSVSVTVALMCGESDCNGNGISDWCDIMNWTSLDRNLNGIPDECESQVPAAVPALSKPLGILALLLVACVGIWALRRRAQCSMKPTR